jgi:precorrin-6B methylase 2
MLGRSRPLVALWLLLGCTPSIDAQAPAQAPTDPQPLIDARGVAPEPAPEPSDEEPAASPEVVGEPTPTPKPAAPDDVGDEINARYYEQTNPKRWAKQFEREGREVFDHRDEILDALQLREGMVVADVGAGTGLFTLELAQRVGPEGKVYAVDVQPYFLDHIGQKARKAGLGNIELVRATQHSAKLFADSVDLVIMCDAYHHVERPADYLSSLKWALRPGGRLVIVDYIAIEGRSEAWLLEHVRATPQQFRAEIEGAGFRFLRAHEGMLEENFFYEFERP